MAYYRGLEKTVENLVMNLEVVLTFNYKRSMAVEELKWAAAVDGDSLLTWKKCDKLITSQSEEEEKKLPRMQRFSSGYSGFQCYYLGRWYSKTIS